jgi:hypothetical protein
MARESEYAPGEVIPSAGTYELLDIFGSPTGIRVSANDGERFPPAPRGHSWTRVEDANLQC